MCYLKETTDYNLVGCFSSQERAETFTVYSPARLHF